MSATGEHSFVTFVTKPGAIQDLLTTYEPQRVAIEIGSAAGWVHDLALAMGLEIQVANSNHEAWRWKNVKRKTDKDDALKLAQLTNTISVYPTSTGFVQLAATLPYRVRAATKRRLAEFARDLSGYTIEFTKLLSIRLIEELPLRPIAAIELRGSEGKPSPDSDVLSSPSSFAID